MMLGFFLSQSANPSPFSNIASVQTYDLTVGNSPIYLCQANAGHFSPNPSSCSVAGPNPIVPFLSVDGFASASGDAFGLHANTALLVTALDNLGPGSTLLATDATALLHDSLILGGSGAGFLDMTITTHGTFSNGNGRIGALTDLGIGVTGASGFCDFTNAGQCTAHSPVTFGTTIFVNETLEASTLVSISGNAGTMTGAFADFSDTAFISALQFTDANGAPLNIPYLSASGLTYPMPQSVPEPASLGLILIGLVLVYRRRANSKTASERPGRQLAGS